MKEKIKETRDGTELSMVEDLYSAEVQELMGKIPPVILRVGIISISMLVVGALLLCCFVKVPVTTTFPLKLSNVNVLKEVRGEQPGYIVECVPARRVVHRGDTLLLLANNHGMTCDTVCIRAPIDGIAYACASFAREEYVDKGTSLFFMVDAIKDKITGIGRVNVEQKHEMEKMPKVETQLNGQRLYGKVVSVARYANPLDETYAVNLDFKYPMEMEREVVWNNHAEAKITTKNQTVMENIFPLLRMIKHKR